MYKCNSCGTERLKTKGKSNSQCIKCSRIVKRINKVNKLSFENPDDHTVLKNKLPWFRLDTEEEFNEVKDLYLDAFNSKISLYKIIESDMKKDVDAMDIELFLRFQLRNMFPLNKRADIEAKFYQYAWRFREMTSNERNAVYKTLVWIWEELVTRVKVNIDREKEKELKEKYLKIYIKNFGND